MGNVEVEQGAVRILLSEDKDGYLHIKPISKEVTKAILTSTEGKERDLPFFWGKGKEAFLNDLEIPWDIRRTIPQRAARSLLKTKNLISLVRERVASRLRREASIAKTEVLLSSTLRLDTKTFNSLPENLKILHGIIAPVDRVIKFWLLFIAQAKRDFLLYHIDKDRESNEDYVSARSLLFEEGYAIYFDEPGKEQLESGKYITLRELIETLIDICAGRELDSWATSSTLDGLRSHIAALSGDPRLMERYPTTEKRAPFLPCVEEIEDESSDFWTPALSCIEKDSENCLLEEEDSLLVL